MHHLVTRSTVDVKTRSGKSGGATGVAKTAEVRRASSVVGILQ